MCDKPLLSLRAAILLLSLALAGCASLEQRRAATWELMASSGWVRQDIPAGDFVLASWQAPTLQRSKTLRVYIEGDGLAWLNRTTPSFDPTPLNPLAFKLAAADPSGQAVYLARPCQFVLTDSCTQQHWTSHRFSEEVVAATDAAIDSIAARLGASQVELVGFSGGAAVAMLVAARRDDVQGIITVAGNLDHEHWSKRLGYIPLWGSLNAADVAEKLAALPQRHYVGGDDPIITQSELLSYQSRLPPGHRSELRVIEDYDHHCCWIDDWPTLLER